ncbi:peroxisomal nicotinamide adenine dinucleotide carrier-like [Actinidia eriantha]|uniref:peroxisomal nicotinamide adenine dinucleotide carrier-like n=1 Tax=Actinidia eriantha TaxID=165200 RepID=UPI00258F0521|nr:peroxisomal nicotinamide adenine dinucleotide carrier-like [Actinidia eriantha]
MSDALINGLAGAGGGIIAQLITYPLQTKEKRKLGTVEQMYQVVKHEGWSRLYSGLAPSLVGTAASQGSFNGTGLVVSFKLPRFFDMYTLTIASADPASINICQVTC